MTIFIREWQRNKKALIIWSLTISFMIFLLMSLFPSFAENSEAMEEFLKAYPEGFLEAFGLDKVSMTSILGYFNTEAYSFLTLFGSIYAMILSASLLSKEENEKTIEFLLAKPVTRIEILTNKLALLILNLFLFTIINSITAYIAFEAFKIEDYDKSVLFLLLIAPFLLYLTFASIGFLFSVFIKKTKSVYSLSIGLVLAAYFLNIIANVSDKLTFLKYFSPFHYVDSADIIVNEQLDISNIIVMLLITSVCISLSYYLYIKKDITI